MSFYGRQGTIVAKAGQREALAAILLGSVRADAMPGCRLYLIGASEADADALLITEVWDNADAHKASLAVPAVREAIGRAMPLIERVGGDGMVVLAGFGDASG